MGASEMFFVGGFTVLCIGASTIVCKVVMMDMQERLKQAKSDMYYWKKQMDDERMARIRWRSQSESWKGHYERENAENAKLRRHIAELQRNRQTTTQSTPSLAGEEKTIMVKALKKAMFDAHPDRGGKQDDFIKINQLYKKLK